MNKHVKKLLSFVTRKPSFDFNSTTTNLDDEDSSFTSTDVITEPQSVTAGAAKRKRGRKSSHGETTKVTQFSYNTKNVSSSMYDVTENCGSNRNVNSDSFKSRDSIGSYGMTSSITNAKEVRGLSFEEETPTLSDEVELTDDQKAELKQAFSMFEKTGKGRIQARDLGELLRCLGWNPSEQDLEEARHELEMSSGDASYQIKARGTISFSEVEAYIARRGGIYYGNNAEEDIMVAFQVLDKTGSGKITVSDFRHFMTTMGERMSHEEVEELIACSTRGGKDYIEYRDLVHAVQQSPT